MKTLAVFAFFIATAFAQQAHQVALVWADTANPAGTTYNVYRLTGACPAVAPTLTALQGFAVLNTAPITVKSYVDSTVAGGTTYCYGVTAVNGANQSGFSAAVPAAVPTLFAPTLSITISQ